LGVLSLGCRSSVALKVQPEWKAQAHNKIRLQQNNAHCRRSVLLEGLMLCGIVAGSGSKPIEAAVLKSGAEAELNPGLTQEKISKVASKIPGYGPSDCYYPAFFKGLWEVEREIVGVNTPLGLDKVESPSVLQAASALLNVKVQYQTRYIARGGDGSLVADRAFTARSLGRAIAPATFRDASWEPENPNILSSTYSDGVVKEVKVTKRSFETPSPETFGTSEYARVAMAGALGSVPQ
ncbi:unnamed protein product, partial [Heterosigma akashiwo]